MLGEREVAAPLVAQRAAHGALGLAHRRFQPGEGVGIQLAGAPARREASAAFARPVRTRNAGIAFALFAPAASRPGQHRAVRRRRGRQVCPGGHPSTVRQRFLRLVLRGAAQTIQLRHRFTSGRPYPSQAGVGVGAAGLFSAHGDRGAAGHRPGRTAGGLERSPGPASSAVLARGQTAPMFHRCRDDGTYASSVPLRPGWPGRVRVRGAGGRDSRDTRESRGGRLSAPGTSARPGWDQLLRQPQ